VAIAERQKVQCEVYSESGLLAWISGWQSLKD